MLTDSLSITQYKQSWFLKVNKRRYKLPPRTWHAGDVHLGQVPCLENHHGEPGGGGLVAHGHQELAPTLVLQLPTQSGGVTRDILQISIHLTFILRGEISRIRDSGLTSESFRSKFSISSITSPMTSSRLYRSKLRTTKCRVRILTRRYNYQN